MKYSNQQIKEIAERIDLGSVCYCNRKTGELKFIVDPDNPYSEEEFWREDLDEIEKNWEDYFTIKKMPARDAFQIMEDFIDQVSNQKIKNRLIYALNNRKPFRNFKYEVDYNETVRQQWFKFKDYRYQEWVKDYLENIDWEDQKTQNEVPKIMGYFNDDGSQINPNLHPLPNLCMSCKKRENPNEEILCNLTRIDQLGKSEFICFAYEKED